ncbi:MAG: cytochrome c oxidase subunit [Humisphaera sp.]|nr:cytochrome c oxidase subunit [Humisphaera sp.]
MELTTHFSRLTHSLTGVAADRGSIPVWAGFIAAPIVWGLHLQLGYMLVPWLCTTQRYWAVHLVTIVCLAISGWCTWLCWREWRHVGGGNPSSAEPPIEGRARFVAVVGLMSAALFTLLIAAGHIPIFFFSPCWD